MRPLKKILYLFIFLLLISFIGVGHVYGAEVLFESPQDQYGLGGEISVDVLLDPLGSSLNALDGTIVFDRATLEFKDINDSDSVINYWVERPHLVNGEIVFSGIIPGGFSGVLSPYYNGAHPGKIFTLHFIARDSGQAEITGSKITLYQNDGKGSPIVGDQKPLILNISPRTGSIIVSTDADKTSPEDFTPQVSNSPVLFNGKWFVAFNATDRESGIDHYEIQETWKSDPSEDKWENAISPYELHDQARRSNIFIKAVDNAGNEKIETIVSSSSSIWSPAIKESIILVIILIGAMLLRYIFNERKKVS